MSSVKLSKSDFIDISMSLCESLDITPKSDTCSTQKAQDNCQDSTTTLERGDDENFHTLMQPTDVCVGSNADTDSSATTHIACSHHSIIPYSSDPTRLSSSDHCDKPSEIASQNARACDRTQFNGTSRADLAPVTGLSPASTLQPVTHGDCITTVRDGDKKTTDGCPMTNSDTEENSYFCPRNNSKQTNTNTADKKSNCCSDLDVDGTRAVDSKMKHIELLGMEKQQAMDPSGCKNLSDFLADSNCKPTKSILEATDGDVLEFFFRRYNDEQEATVPTTQVTPKQTGTRDNGVNIQTDTGSSNITNKLKTMDAYEECYPDSSDELVIDLTFGWSSEDETIPSPIVTPTKILDVGEQPSENIVRPSLSPTMNGSLTLAPTCEPLALLPILCLRETTMEQAQPTVGIYSNTSSLPVVHVHTENQEASRPKTLSEDAPTNHDDDSCSSQRSSANQSPHNKTQVDDITDNAIKRSFRGRYFIALAMISAD